MGRSKAAYKRELCHNKKFFWQDIICQYRVPRHIIVDNAKYFDNAMFKEF
jgi:hypothetical protein